MLQADEHRERFVLNEVLRALGLAKSSWYSWKRRRTDDDKYRELRVPLMVNAKRHPEYGHRQVMSELRESRRAVNHKAIERLHCHWNLSVMRRVQQPKPNPIAVLLKKSGSKINLVAQLGGGISDLGVVYADFPAVVYRRGRAKAQLMPIVDRGGDLVVEHALGPASDAELALEAWRRVIRTLKSLGRRIVNGRFKGENRDLVFVEEGLESLKRVVDKRIRYYNLDRKHAALGNLSPMAYLKKKGHEPR